MNNTTKTSGIKTILILGMTIGDSREFDMYAGMYKRKEGTFIHMGEEEEPLILEHHSLTQFLKPNEDKTEYNHNNKKICPDFVLQVPLGFLWEYQANSIDYEGKTWDPLESTCRHASLSIL